MVCISMARTCSPTSASMGMSTIAVAIAVRSPKQLARFAATLYSPPETWISSRAALRKGTVPGSRRVTRAPSERRSRAPPGGTSRTRSGVVSDGCDSAIDARIAVDRSHEGKPAPVDDQGVAGDEAGRVGEQEESRLDHLLRLRGAAHGGPRVQGADVQEPSGDQGLLDRRVDESGDQGIDPNPAAAPFSRQGLGHLQKAGLGDGV